MPSLLRSASFLLLLLATATALHAQLVEEVPFITSPDNVTLEMLRVARVGAGDHLIDLGSGDGRIVITAARRFGATGLGVEIVPELVQQSIRNAREAGVADRVRFLEQDLFKTDLAPASVVTMYLLPQVNLQLRPALLMLRPGTRIVSHDWDMGDWKPDQTTVVPVPAKAVGLDKSSKIHLWVVPARVQGLWCMAAETLEIAQEFQQVQAKITGGGAVRQLAGRLEGNLLRLEGGQPLEVKGDRLSNGSMAFERARGERCDG